ncbi:MAG: hypothetical protein ACM359_07585 [Bacillota bacterium]
MITTNQAIPTSHELATVSSASPRNHPSPASRWPEGPSRSLLSPVLPWIPLLTLPLLTTLFFGCHSRPKETSDSFFPPDEPNATLSILDAQASRGARTDATLYPPHFTDSSLNALGRAKLDLMLKDRSGTLPLTVYLDLPIDDPHAAHSVQTYLLDTGLLTSQFQTAFGPNPATLYPAAPALTKLPKTDNPPSQKSPTPSSPQPDPTSDLSPLTNLSNLLPTPKK